MKLFLYFITHSLKNRILRLLKTWVGIVLIVAIAMAVFAMIAGFVTNRITNVPQEGVTVEEVEKRDPALLELIVGGLGIILLTLGFLSANKSGADIFEKADVNILFASPQKPQFNLLLGMSRKIAVLVMIGIIYTIIYIPNIMNIFGVGIFPAAMVVVGVFVLVGYTMLIQTMFFIINSNHPGFKKIFPYLVYGALGALLIGFVMFYRSQGTGIFDAAKNYFNAGFTRYLPVWGWTKGLVLFAQEGNIKGVLITAAALLVFAVCLFLVMWNMKADFYEEAMASADRKDEKMRMMKEGKSWTVAGTGKKDRSDKILRDGLNKGAGASVFFHRDMYNRRRFAFLGFFTKTGLVYALVAAAVAVFFRFALRLELFFPVALALGVCSFYRTTGNSLAKEVDRESFLLIPESIKKKVLWTLAASSLNCLLDLIPAFVIGVIIMRANPLFALIWLLFVVSVDFYGTNAGAFVDLSQPLGMERNLKLFLMILFLYFGLVPDVTVFVIFGILGHFDLAALIATAINVGVGFIFFSIYTIFPEKGRR